MKALKVLYRPPGKGPERRSAIPSLYGLQYWEGKKTEPEIGKLMVYLDMDEARFFCPTAASWYDDDRRNSLPSRGDMEIWSVECHNLYRIDYLVEADCLGYEEWGGERGSQLKTFWRIVRAGQDPTRRLGGVAAAIKAGKPIWTTDWIIPQERLAVYTMDGLGFAT